MSTEVAGEAEGVTLAACIADGRVPCPDEMNFPQWQAWRKVEGRRPVKRRDGRGRTTVEEVALWRAIMADLYGEGRVEGLEEEDESSSSELREREEAEPESRALVPLSRAVPRAGERKGDSPRPSSAGGPSSAGTKPAGVDEILRELNGVYRPDDESMSEFLERVTRLVLALKSLGHEVATGELEKVTLKAELVLEAYEASGEFDPRKLVRYLRDRFTAIALDTELGAVDTKAQVNAIGELIVSLGGKQSSNSEKLFSTPSAEDQHAVGSPTRQHMTLGEAGPEGLKKRKQAPSLDGDSPLRSKVAALEMELEALKRGSEASGGEKDLAAALEAQTKTLQEALAGRQQSSVTAVKADLNWPTLTDDRTDARDVAQFYEEFEDVCALANNCKGMSFREQLLALRARCRGSRLKTYTNLYRAAWKNGEVLEDPQAVYERIKNKHLMFAESREEKEVRVDNEHVLLMKGKLSGHQFEPLFEASVAELESVGLGKTPRELYLSYLRKMPAYLQKEIRGDKRLWRGESTLRGPQTWEEAHRVVLEYEQREATHKATANAVYMATGEPKVPAAKSDQKKAAKEAAKQTKAVADAAAKAQSVLATQAGQKSAKICFHFRDHGSCPKGANCPWSHDKELRKKALAAMKTSGTAKADQTLAAKGSKGKKGSGKGADKQGKGKGKKPPGTLCPFFQKNGSCRKGAECDMIHSLPATSSSAPPSQGALPTSWGAPSGAAMSNPFAAFSVLVGDPSQISQEQKTVGVLSLDQPAGGATPRLFSLDELPQDWFHVAENEPGGYQYRTVVRVLDKKVETMLDGCAGSNHITEELVIGMLNRAAELNIGPEHKSFPVLRFEKWLYPEYVHGIASGAPVPLKGAVVLRVRLLEGESAENARDGPEIFVRCKVAARGTSDWHGLILGGRALDCQAKMGLGFRPGPDAHVLDTLGIKVPRCEDSSHVRKDRAYPFVSVLSSLDGPDEAEPGGDDRHLLRYDGGEPVCLDPGDGALIPVQRASIVRPRTLPCVRASFRLKGLLKQFQGFGRLETCQV